MSAGNEFELEINTCLAVERVINLYVFANIPYKPYMSKPEVHKIWFIPVRKQFSRFV